MPILGRSRREARGRRLVRSWLRLAATLLAVCFALGSGDVAAQPKKQTVSALVQKAQDLFDEQMYEESIQVLSAALMRPGISREEKIDVYRLLAYNYITLRRDDEADGAVRGLLVLDENFSLPESESPRFRDFFKKTRDAWEADGKPGLKAEKEATPEASKVAVKHAPPAQADEGQAVSVGGTVEDPEATVAKVKLYYRAGSSGKFTTAPVQFAMLRWSAQIPAEAVVPPLVEYYVEALDEGGLPVATRGDAAAPLRIAVVASGSFLTSPWFWVPVGVAVAAAAVITAVVVTSSGEQESPKATVTINVFE
ncbi:MAG: hypothetical protein HY744_29650 [Deltaproteobacteria bacterium]|nr:hypothetical protein [Deltaproteobacteria bacterium]